MPHLVQGDDYFGAGTPPDPYVFAEHVNYFAGFHRLCEELGVDPDQRRSVHFGDHLLDVVTVSDAVSLHFRPPPPEVYEAPLAWRLSSPEGPLGDVTWRGGRELDVRTGPQLAALVRQHVAKALAEPASGLVLDIAMAQLERASAGAVKAVRLPRPEKDASSGDAAAPSETGAPPEAVARLAARAFRGSFFPALGVGLVGAALATATIVASPAEGFDGRAWFLLAVAFLLFVVGTTWAIAAFARWKANASVAKHGGPKA